MTKQTTYLFLVGHFALSWTRQGMAWHGRIIQDLAPKKALPGNKIVGDEINCSAEEFCPLYFSPVFPLVNNAQSLNVYTD